MRVAQLAKRMNQATGFSEYQLSETNQYLITPHLMLPFKALAYVAAEYRHKAYLTCLFAEDYPPLTVLARIRDEYRRALRQVQILLFPA